MRQIVLKGVRVHNLKGVNLSLSPGQFIVFTGVSGSGKSSLAFHTIHIEGQRRYIESLSMFARRHLGQMAKPDADLIQGISPTVAIEQKTGGKTPRSTVATMTGIYDFLRVLYARMGERYCPVSGEKLLGQSSEEILAQLLCLPAQTKLVILAPYAKEQKGELKELFAELLRKGFTKARIEKETIIDIAEAPSLDPKESHNLDVVIDRLIVQKEEKGRLTEAVQKALDLGKGMMSVLRIDTKEELFFSEHAYSPKSNLSYPPLEPADFSFNHPSTMCPHCMGLGIAREFILEKIIDPNLSIAQDCCKIASSYKTVRYGNIYDNLASIYTFSVHTPWKNLKEKAQKVFLYGTDKKWTEMEFIHPSTGKRWIDRVAWRGVIEEARQRYQNATSETYRKNIEELMEEAICPTCRGARIKAYPAAVRFKGKTLSEVTSFSIRDALSFFEKAILTHEEILIGEELLKEIGNRLRFLFDVGLHYLSLDRIAPTLSGGEAQRVRLASQIGSGLSHATYVLDEPSIGLHPRDTVKLIGSLRALCAQGNTVIVVEHDEETILAADHIVDVGPGAGSKGGQIIASCDLAHFITHSHSSTALYLSGKKTISPHKQRPPLVSLEQTHCLEIKGASHHNLKNIDVAFPLKSFIAVTGVSGSGKSSLITDILYPALSNKLHSSTLKVGAHKSIEGIENIDKVIAIDQSPIGRTPRSNPATYVKAFDEIRDLFATLPQAKAEGYLPGHFSFNVKEGSCPHCSGMGMVKIDMDFLEDTWETCAHCRGHRFEPPILQVLYKGKNIYDVLEMTIEEALSFFHAIPSLSSKLQTLVNVGLSYLKLGQSSPTLSGGEAQRIKLAKELARPSSGKTVYLLDEPTTGLHAEDIDKLVQILHNLVDKGNTVLVIEHHMELVKTADWVIDLGPEGGVGGGNLIGSAPPQEITKKNSPTGKALKELFSKKKRSFSTTKQAVFSSPYIEVEKASQNTLKEVSAKIPHGKITVCTGPSGSGKSSFAFETVYAEGQRRYIESLSAYARQYVKQSPKPKVESIKGLLASIAIEQKHHAGNPRSTIATMTEIHDFLRLIFAFAGIAHCPDTQEELRYFTKSQITEELLSLPEGTKVQVLAPLSTENIHSTLFPSLLKEGFLRVRVDGKEIELDSEERVKKNPKELFLIVDRLVMSPSSSQRLYSALDLAAHKGENRIVIFHGGKDHPYRLHSTVSSTGKVYPPLTPHSFSFNTEEGMCLECSGLGYQYGANLQKYKTLMRLTPLALMKKLWKDYSNAAALEILAINLQTLGIPTDLPLEKLSENQLQRFLYGPSEDEKMFPLSFKGIGPAFITLAKSGPTRLRQELIGWVEEITCSACCGSRLNPLSRNVRLEGKTLPELYEMPLDKAYLFLAGLILNPKKEHLLKEPVEEARKRLHFLCEMGLGYLSLGRSAPTLSGGETQRVRLARQLGSELTGCLYVLDEPTLGLHPYNNGLLNKALKELCALGNTLLLVEHDPLTVHIADYILDFGPGAGKRGGTITARGSLQEICENPHSLTGAYLSGRKKIPIPQKRRPIHKGEIKIENGSLHNLKRISTKFPLRAITCVTGVSGSGKSTLVFDLLKPAAQLALATRQKKESLVYQNAHFHGLDNIDKLLVLDQNPVGHTNRADVSTYVDLSTPLRQFFSELPKAKMLGLKPKYFSANHIKGMCMSCFGLGKQNVSLQFLPPVQIPCPACQGFRLNPLSLQVEFRGKHLGKLLQLTVEEALVELDFLPKVQKILHTLVDVGLDYLELGQEVASLSGGEAQRLRLAKELAKRSTGKTLYLFDEPTIGLHSEDIARLLKIFHTLADKGNTLILIEHNIDIIKNADHLIDIGPEGGPNGGEIIFEGTPEELQGNTRSYTAAYL